MAILHQKPSSIPGRLQSKINFHHWTSSIGGSLPSKVVFYLRCLPSNVVLPFLTQCCLQFLILRYSPRPSACFHAHKLRIGRYAPSESGVQPNCGLFFRTVPLTSVLCWQNLCTKFIAIFRCVSISIRVNLTHSVTHPQTD